MFQAEREKARAGPPSGLKDRGGRAPTKKETSPLSSSSKEKTNLKRRGDVEPLNIKGEAEFYGHGFQKAQIKGGKKNSCFCMNLLVLSVAPVWP